MLDLNSVESVHHAPISELQEYLGEVDEEELDSIRVQLENQYIQFMNLGKDILEDIDIKYKAILFSELVNYTNNNYLTITNFDETNISLNKLLEVGEFIYKFICIDCYNTVIPNYIDRIGCLSIDQFDLYFQNTLGSDSSNFKTDIIKTINNIINQLTNLSTLDKNVVKDEKYQNLLKRYMYYSELINFGDSNQFLTNYFRPVIMKNINDIIWRVM